MDLKDKKICIIGLGYVGLPLAVAFAEKFKVIGYEQINLEYKILKAVPTRLLR